MASRSCGAGDRCRHPELRGAHDWTACDTCGAIFHIPCLPGRETTGPGTAEAELREVLEVFHCPGECTTKAKEALSRKLPEMMASLPGVLSSNTDFSGASIDRDFFKSPAGVNQRKYLYGDPRLPATVKELKERLEKGNISTIGHYKFVVKEMNRRLKDYMTHDGQSAADALQVDLLRLVGQEATTENSEAAEATIRRCSSCNLIPLAGELQVCEVGHTICPGCRRTLCCPLCLPHKRRRLKPIESPQGTQQPQEAVEEPVQPEKVKGPRGRPRKVALENSSGQREEAEHDGDEAAPTEKKRPRLNVEQRSRLLRAFEENNYLNEGRKKSLATDLGLNAKTVSNWFQNRRHITKRRDKAPGVSQYEPMDDAYPSAADPLPGTSKEDSGQKLRQVPEVAENLEQDHEPLRPLKPARTDQGGVAVDARVRNEFVDILGTPNGDSDLSDVGITLPSQQDAEPVQQSGSCSQPGATRNQERQQQNTASTVRNNLVDDDEESGDGKVETPVLHTRDGMLVFRGYKPGMSMVQQPDGKKAVYPSAAPLYPDAASFMPISPNTLVTPVRVNEGAGPSSAPREEEIGGLMASQSAQNHNSVTNDATDESDPDDLHALPRDQSR